MKLRELLNLLIDIKEEIGCSTPMICGGICRDKVLGRLDRISDVDITTGDKSIDYLCQEFYKKLNKTYDITKEVKMDIVQLI
jgi:hypothetical protein